MNATDIVVSLFMCAIGVLFVVQRHKDRVEVDAMRALWEKARAQLQKDSDDALRWTGEGDLFWAEIDELFRWEPGASFQLHRREGGKYQLTVTMTRRGDVVFFGDNLHDAVRKFSDAHRKAKSFMEGQK